MSNRFAVRRDALRRELKKLKLPGLIVQKDENVTYLTGFSGEDSVLLLLADREVLLTDSRFVTQLGMNVPDCHCTFARRRRLGRDDGQGIGRVTCQDQTSSIGIEADTMTVGLRDRISEHAKTLISPRPAA